MIYSTDPKSAENLEEMQRIARNQILAKVYQLEERIQNLRKLILLVDSVREDNYVDIIHDVNYYGDANELTALEEIANNYQWMVEGGYF